LTLTRFFNNSTLSDVIIKQIYNGEAREYYAHKAVLCMNSKYFLRAFTGDFKVRKANYIPRSKNSVLTTYVNTGSDVQRN
jgi:hypothetical protein